MRLPIFSQKTVLLAVVLLTLAAASLFSRFVPFVPDYDGLAYYRLADRIQDWVLGQGDGSLWQRLTASYLKYWPVTNGLSVYFVAFFGDLLGRNMAPLVLHSIYLWIFSFYLCRVRGAGYALVAIALLCGSGLFFRLFTTLTSDFGVGLWLMALMVAIMDDRADRRWMLWILVPLGILLRTVDAIFILSIATAFVVGEMALHRRFSAAKVVALHIGIPLILTAALLWRQFLAAFRYVRETTWGVSAASWKSVGGVSTRLDVFERYLEFLNLYHAWVVIVFALSVVGGLLLSGERRAYALRATMLGGGVMVPLVFAGALHIQLTFWVYAAMVFVVLEIVRLATEEFVKNIRVRKITIVAISVLVSLSFFQNLADSWRRERGYLVQLSELTRLNTRFLETLRQGEDIRGVVTNYIGVGPISAEGLSVALRRNLDDKNVADVYSRGKPIDYYFGFKDSANLYIAAKESYLFPRHFGMNDHVEDLAQHFADRAGVLGFRHVAEVVERGQGFDLWYRPGVLIFPEYAVYGDNWIAGRLRFQLGTNSLCEKQTVSGLLSLGLMFPEVADAPGFQPPFEIKVLDAQKETRARVIVGKAGSSKVELALSAVPCGGYEVVFSQQFSTATDSRRLSALLENHTFAFRFDPLL